jgi:UDP:flavonoid glycosyltransferase YjiC (YdhE family)
VRFLLVAQGSFGDINPCAGIALRLQERGHEVLFLTTEYYEPFLKRLGIEVVSTLSREEHLRIFASSDWTRHFGVFPAIAWELLAGPARREYAAIQDLYLPGETVLLSRGRGLGARIAQEKLGVPMATLVMSPKWLRSIYHPGPASMLPKPVRKWLKSAFDSRVSAKVMPETNRLRNELGLPELRGIFDDWIFSPQLMLGLFPEWFQPPLLDWPEIHLSGFPLFDGSDSKELAVEVEEFLGDGEPPLLVNAVSWMQAAREFFTRSVAALRRTGARAILLSPFPDNVPPNLPPGIRYFGYVPHRLLLPRAAGIIHQGGIGTMAGALLAGIPQLIVPVNLIDGPYNGRRAASLGVGAMLWPAQYRPGRVASKLQTLLASSTVKEKCRHYAAKIKGEDGVGAACRLIEEVFCGG